MKDGPLYGVDPNSDGEKRDLRAAIVKRSIVVHGHKTSVSLEDAFWAGLREMAKSRDMTMSAVVGDIDNKRESGNLSSMIRLFVLEFVRAGRTSDTQRPGYSGSIPARADVEGN